MNNTVEINVTSYLSSDCPPISRQSDRKYIWEKMYNITDVFNKGQKHLDKRTFYYNIPIILEFRTEEDAVKFMMTESDSLWSGVEYRKESVPNQAWHEPE